MKTVERIEKEYEEFKKDLLNKPKEEIYNSFDKISFYENIYEFLLNSEEETMELLKDITLAQLYKNYLNTENINWSEEEEIINFLKNIYII